MNSKIVRTCTRPTKAQERDNPSIRQGRQVLPGEELLVLDYYWKRKIQSSSME